MTLNNKLTIMLLTLSTVLISSCGTTSQEDISILEQANNTYSQEKKLHPRAQSLSAMIHTPSINKKM